ncbi:MAG: hypothetical protein AAGE61_11670, partial [Pseudomonadota bacterium]
MPRPIGIIKQAVFVAAIAAGGYWGWVHQDSLLKTAGLVVPVASNAVASGNATDRASSPKGKPVIARPVRFAADRLTLEAVGTGRARYSVM